MKKIFGTLRTGRAAFIALSPSKNDPNKLFISSPQMIEMTRGQVHDYMVALNEMSKELWGNDDTK